MAETLGRIEERFGERLTSLQTDSRTHFDHLNQALVQAREVERAAEKQEVVQVDRFREVVQEVLQTSNLPAEEKEAYKQQLEQQANDLARVRAELDSKRNELHELTRRAQTDTEVQHHGSPYAAIDYEHNAVISILRQRLAGTGLTVRSLAVSHGSALVQLDRIPSDTSVLPTHIRKRKMIYISPRGELFCAQVVPDSVKSGGGDGIRDEGDINRTEV